MVCLRSAPLPGPAPAAKTMASHPSTALPIPSPTSSASKIDHHRLGAVGRNITRLLLLADESPDLMAIFGQHPYQTPRRLAVRASDQNPHETTSFESGSTSRLARSSLRLSLVSPPPCRRLVSTALRALSAFQPSRLEASPRAQNQPP